MFVCLDIMLIILYVLYAIVSWYGAPSTGMTSVPTRKGADLLLVFHGDEGRYTCESMSFNDAAR